MSGDAGEIIQTFGHFVVGGDFVVGGIVFLVLVLIQFIVVAKGSERVAEVSARFTLDAMPGKQMSIDADLRNELIDKDDARRMRREMDRESRLYGAMDGAMKFVKGDAIAGILISFVNIIGGLVVGSTKMGMTLTEAAQRYSLLTIGDGLVSQIPSLLISLAAGLVVTRVAMSDVPKSGNLASDMLRQVFESPRSLAVATCLLLFVAVSSPWTGFPMLPFLVLGGLAGVSAYRASHGEEVEEEKGQGRASPRRAQPGEPTPPEPEPKKSPFGRLEYEPEPLVIEMHESLDSLLVVGAKGRTPQQRVDAIRQQVSKSLGLSLPRAHLVSKSKKAPQNGYSISIGGARVARGNAGLVDGLRACFGDGSRSALYRGAAGEAGRLQRPCVRDCRAGCGHGERAWFPCSAPLRGTDGAPECRLAEGSK